MHAQKTEGEKETEGERENAQVGGDTERGGEKIPSSAEPNRGLDPMNCELMT